MTAQKKKCEIKESWGWKARRSCHNGRNKKTNDFSEKKKKLKFSKVGLICPQGYSTQNKQIITNLNRSITMCS